MVEERQPKVEISTASETSRAAPGPKRTAAAVSAMRGVAAMAAMSRVRT